MFSLLYFFKLKTADEMRISYGSSDVCSSDLEVGLKVVIGRLIEGDHQHTEPQPGEPTETRTHCTASGSLIVRRTSRIVTNLTSAFDILHTATADVRKYRKRTVWVKRV